MAMYFQDAYGDVMSPQSFPGAATNSPRWYSRISKSTRRGHQMNPTGIPVIGPFGKMLHSSALRLLFSLRHGRPFTRSFNLGPPQLAVSQ